MAWRYDRKILALYSDWTSRNSWVYVDGGFGWMQFRSDNFDAVGYMTTLATQAFSDGKYVNIDEDPVPGVISAIYVF